MKTWKIITVAGFALVAVALVTASAFAYMGGRGLSNTYGTNTGVTSPYGVYGGMMGGGMMGGYGYPQTGTQPYQATPTYPSQYGSGGCRGRAGWNGYVGAPNTSTGTAISIDTAVSIAQNYSASLTNKDIVVDEVEEYTQNFYVLFKEKSTGIGAFEMLIDKYTGAIYPEMGPNMMWNTKYGMMSGGMMGWFTGTQTGPMTVTVEQAKTNAQQFLSANYPGTTVGDVDTFYGYYHIDVLQGINTYGMLSVNGYTGQVWYHTWHGVYIQTVEL
jgi:hypothetical protein